MEMTYKKAGMIEKKTGIAPVKQGFVRQSEKKAGMTYKHLFIRKIVFIFLVLGLKHLSNHLLTY